MHWPTPATSYHNRWLHITMLHIARECNDTSQRHSPERVHRLHWIAHKETLTLNKRLNSIEIVDHRPVQNAKQRLDTDIYMRMGQHPFSNRVLPEWRTQIVCHAASPRRKNNELLLCLFFDGRRVVPDEHLLCYPTQNVSQVDGYLFRSVTQSNKCVVFCPTKFRICPNFGGSTDPPSCTPMLTSLLVCN